jgi:hypothetical protein
MEKMVLVVVKRMGPYFALIHGEANVLLFSLLPPFVSEWSFIYFSTFKQKNILSLFSKVMIKQDTHNFSNMVHSLFHIALDIFWMIRGTNCHLIHDSNVFSFPCNILNPVVNFYKQ